MTLRCAALVLAVFALLPAASATAQTVAKPAAKPAPKTPDGKPDLQGFWDFRTLTPLERPASVRDKAVLTEEEARALQAQNADRRSRAAASAMCATLRARRVAARGRSAATTTSGSISATPSSRTGARH